MSRRARSVSLRPLSIGLALLLAAALVLGRTDPAAAAVTHLHGFRATVDGFTSWYGSYGMGELGPSWCIDHGIRSPDPAYRFVPTDLAGVSGEVQSAMAWMVATHGRGTDRVTHAALMLALHDLMGAHYPSGRLDVDRLSSSRLAGFGGAEGQVLARARLIKADGLAHRHLRGPLRLSVEIGRATAAGRVPVTVRASDTAGVALAGLAVSFEGSTASLSAASGTTGPDGAFALSARAGGAPSTVQVTATAPHLPLDAWASTTTRAQRVARPTLDRLAASGTLAATTGKLRVRKLDAATGQALAGASLVVRHDSDADGTFELIVAEFISTAEPTVIDGLRPGRYEITETAAPAGYDVLAAPLLIEVAAGGQAEAFLENQPTLPAAPVAATPAPTTTAPPTTAPPTTAPPTTAPPTTVPAPAPEASEAAPTTTQPPATTTTTTATTTTTPSTSTTHPPTTTAPPPVTVLAAPALQPVRATLPRTGVDALGLGLFGTGLLLVGRSLLDLGHRRPRAGQPSAPRSRLAAMRASS